SMPARIARAGDGDRWHTCRMAPPGAAQGTGYPASVGSGPRGEGGSTTVGSVDPPAEGCTAVRSTSVGSSGRGGRGGWCSTLTERRGGWVAGSGGAGGAAVVGGGPGSASERGRGGRTGGGG